MEIIRNADGSLLVPIPEVDITTMTTPLRPRRATVRRVSRHPRLVCCIR